MKHTVTFFVATTLLVAGTGAVDPWTPSPLCPFPSTDLVRFPYEGDCTKYWECYNGARYPMDCPTWLEFNAAESRCYTPSLANCDPDATIIYPTFSHSTQSTASTQDWGPKPKCPFPSNELIFFPVATNCAKYWECFQGIRYLMSCPPGLHWNTVYNYCDYPGNANCSINNATTTSSPVPTTPSTNTTTTPGGNTPDPQCPYPSDEITFYPHPTECNKYYECYQGHRYLMSCPSGLYWNEKENACDYRENVNCDRDTAFIAATLLVSSAYAQWTPSPLCPFPSEELTRFQYEGDCSKYWECYEGARYPMDCPSGLEYNAAESRCDSPDIANCDPDVTIIYPTFSHSTQTTPSQGPTSDPGPRPECPFPSDVITFYPVVNNCSQYWECFQGNRYLMNCPSGQYWSDTAQTCDYSYNVPCDADNNSTTTAKPTTSPGTGTTTTSTPGTDITKTTGNTATIPTTTSNPYDVLCKDKADGTYIPDPDDCHKFFECVSHKVIEGTCPNDLVWNEAALTCDFPSNVQCNTLKFH